MDLTVPLSILAVIVMAYIHIQQTAGNSND